jgi:hypothetical protein
LKSPVNLYFVKCIKLKFRMSKLVSPSPIIESFVENVREAFPAAEVLKLERFSVGIGSTTSAADPHRARRCVEWAIEMADDRNQSHPRWREFKELHQSWKDAWFALEFGVIGPQGAGHHPVEDIRIQWVENAVAVAKGLGEEDGWNNSPWEELLEGLIEMESTHSENPPE